MIPDKVFGSDTPISSHDSMRFLGEMVIHYADNNLEKNRVSQPETCFFIDARLNEKHEIAPD